MSTTVVSKTRTTICVASTFGPDWERPTDNLRTNDERIISFFIFDSFFINATVVALRRSLPPETLFTRLTDVNLIARDFFFFKVTALQRGVASSGETSIVDVGNGTLGRKVITRAAGPDYPETEVSVRQAKPKRSTQMRADRWPVVVAENWLWRVYTGPSIIRRGLSPNPDLLSNILTETGTISGNYSTINTFTYYLEYFNIDNFNIDNFGLYFYCKFYLKLKLKTARRNKKGDKLTFFFTAFTAPTALTAPTLSVITTIAGLFLQFVKKAIKNIDRSS